MRRLDPHVELYADNRRLAFRVAGGGCQRSLNGGSASRCAIRCASSFESVLGRWRELFALAVRHLHEPNTSSFGAPRAIILGGRAVMLWRGVRSASPVPRRRRAGDAMFRGRAAGHAQLSDPSTQN